MIEQDREPVYSFVVLGEMGEGKSSLIQHFYDNTSNDDKQRIYQKFFGTRYCPLELRVGNDYTGVTDVPELYAVRIGQKDVVLMDTPGIDETLTPRMITRFITKVDKFHGVIFVKSGSTRYTLGAQVVPNIVKTTIQSANGHDVWESVILVSTKKDLDDHGGCSKKRLQDLKRVISGKIGGAIRHAAAVCLRKNAIDVEDFVTLMNNLKFENRLEYSNPSAAEMAGIFGSGWTVNVTQAYITERGSSARNNLAMISAGILGIAYGIATGGVGLIGGAVIGLGVAKFFVPPIVKSLGLVSNVSIESSREDVVAMCALLSGVVYDVTTRQELESSLKKSMEKEKYELLILHNNVRPAPAAIERDYDHRFLSVAMNMHGVSTLFIAWKGTDRIAEFIKNANVAPTTCSLWHDAFPHIRAHSGMVPIIENCINLFKETLVHLVEKHDIKQIVFTGHSLGGGLAQIALMAFIGQRALGFKNFDESVKLALQGVLFSAYAFASPMVFSFPDNDDLTPGERNALTQFESRCTLFIYGQDMVPHMPANVDFWKPAMRKLVSEKAASAVASWWEQSMIGADLEKVIPDLGYQVGGNTNVGDVKVFAGYIGLNSKRESTFSGSHASLGKILVSLVVGDLARHAFDFVASKVDEEFDQLVKEYKHIAQILYFNPEKQDLKPEDFIGMQLKKSATVGEILESHSVFPNCIGSYMCKRRNMMQRFLYPQLFSKRA